MTDTTLKHVAIIMDGNGRWAKAKGKLRYEGHYIGVQRVRDIAIHASAKGVKYLTLYAFSTENWKRPQDEVDYIMSLPKIFFAAYLKELMENDIKVMMLGEMDRIPAVARDIFKDAILKTKDNKGMVLAFAVNYGSRDEIIRACKEYAKEVKEGREDDLDEEKFSDLLFTKGMPDVDLMIRTSGEKRISNFLLWQIAYSELIFTDTLWPDFTREEFDKCIEEYKGRHRRFGGLDENASD